MKKSSKGAAKPLEALPVGLGAQKAKTIPKNMLKESAPKGGALGKQAKKIGAIPKKSW